MRKGILIEESNMSNRLTPIIVAAAALAAPLAMANPDGFRDTRSEAGTEFVGSPSSLSRAEMERDQAVTPRAGFVSSREEAQQAQSTRAIQSTGWSHVSGEAGWVFDGR